MFHVFIAQRMRDPELRLALRALHNGGAASEFIERITRFSDEAASGAYDFDLAHVNVY
jgi:hypothetical protein